MKIHWEFSEISNVKDSFKKTKQFSVVCYHYYLIKLSVLEHEGKEEKRNPAICQVTQWRTLDNFKSDADKEEYEKRKTDKIQV